MFKNFTVLYFILLTLTLSNKSYANPNASCKALVISTVSLPKKQIEELENKGFEIIKTVGPISDLRLRQYIEPNNWIFDFTTFSILGFKNIEKPKLKYFRWQETKPFRLPFISFNDELKSTCNELILQVNYFNNLETELDNALNFLMKKNSNFQWGKYFATFEERLSKERDLNYLKVISIYERFIKKSYQVIEFSNSNFFEQLNLARKTIMNDLNISNYCNNGDSMTSAILRGCTDCEGNTTTIISALNDLNIYLPSNFKLAVQIYSDHIEPVLFNTQEKSYLSLLTGGALKTEILAPIYSADILIYSSLKSEKNPYVKHYINKLADIDEDSFLLARENSYESVLSKKTNINQKNNSLFSNIPKISIPSNGEAPEKKSIPFNEITKELEKKESNPSDDKSDTGTDDNSGQKLLSSIKSLFAKSINFLSFSYECPVADVFDLNTLINDINYLNAEDKLIIEESKHLIEYANKESDYKKRCEYLKQSKYAKKISKLLDSYSKYSILNGIEGITFSENSYLSKNTFSMFLTNYEDLTSPKYSPFYFIFEKINKNYFLNLNQKSRWKLFFDLYRKEVKDLESSDLIIKARNILLNNNTSTTLTQESIDILYDYIFKLKNLSLARNYLFNFQSIVYDGGKIDIFQYSSSKNFEKNYAILPIEEQTAILMTEFGKSLTKHHRDFLTNLNNLPTDYIKKFFDIFNFWHIIAEFSYTDDLSIYRIEKTLELYSKQEHILIRHPLLGLFYKMLHDNEIQYIAPLTTEEQEQNNTILETIKKNIKWEEVNNIKKNIPEVDLPEFPFSDSSICSSNPGEIVDFGGIALECPKLEEQKQQEIKKVDHNQPKDNVKDDETIHKDIIKKMSEEGIISKNHSFKIRKENILSEEIILHLTLLSPKEFIASPTNAYLVSNMWSANVENLLLKIQSNFKNNHTLSETGSFYAPEYIYNKIYLNYDSSITRNEFTNYDPSTYNNKKIYKINIDKSSLNEFSCIVSVDEDNFSDCKNKIFKNIDKFLININTPEWLNDSNLIKNSLLIDHIKTIKNKKQLSTTLNTSFGHFSKLDMSWTRSYSFELSDKIIIGNSKRLAEYDNFSFYRKNKNTVYIISDTIDEEKSKDAFIFNIKKFIFNTGSNFYGYSKFEF